MSQKLIPASLVAVLFLLLATWLIFHHREYRLYPNRDSSHFALYDYTDSADQGASTGDASIQGQNILFTYKLNPGFAYPYAGMGIDVITRDSASKKVLSYLDLSGYDSLRIRLRSAQSSELRIQIITDDPALSRPESPLTRRFLVQNVAVERGWSTKSLWLGSFSIPEWWFSANKVKPDPGNRMLHRTAQLDIQNGSSTPIGTLDSVEVEEIVFVGENQLLGWILGIIAILLITAFGALSWLGRERLRTEKALHLAQRRETIMGQAEKVPLVSHRTEDTKKILDYIGKHYCEAELDLESVCKETGVNRNRLSIMLKDEVGTTFKGHLTDLRLAEAMRALAETDLQVTEIAYKVGFGNVSHFNRVFKEHFEITPVEFRRSQKKTSSEA